MIGGQRNCCVTLQPDGRATLEHAGHSLGIDVEGERLPPHGMVRLRHDGTWFSPEGDREGLRFTLVVEADHSHLPCRVVWRKEKRIGVHFET